MNRRQARIAALGNVVALLGSMSGHDEGDLWVALSADEIGDADHARVERAFEDIAQQLADQAQRLIRNERRRAARRAE